MNIEKEITLKDFLNLYEQNDSAHTYIICEEECIKLHIDDDIDNLLSRRVLRIFVGGDGEHVVYIFVEAKMMKHYQVVGFEEDSPVFWFTVTANNFSEALKNIEKDYYMTDMDFQKLEITEVKDYDKI